MLDERVNSGLQKILISACLVKDRVRFDGQHKWQDNACLARWRLENRVVALCPEVTGGLPVPRMPCEITQLNPIKVVDKAGVDRTEAFTKGAQAAIDLVQTYSIKIAILKEKSPSCGSLFCYDGSFSNRLISGEGITTRALRQLGVQVFNENQIAQASDYLQNLEA